MWVGMSPGTNSGVTRLVFEVERRCNPPTTSPGRRSIRRVRIELSAPKEPLRISVRNTEGCAANLSSPVSYRCRLAPTEYPHWSVPDNTIELHLGLLRRVKFADHNSEVSRN